MSICSIEDVDAAVEQPFWFQLYVMRDRGFVRDMIARAARREVQRADGDDGPEHARPASLPTSRTGLTVPLELTLANLLDIATKPAWA